MNKELISVIIIAYNVENYIGKCLESVINQTYTNLEIIIVDDASTDKTSDICIEYQKKDDRIKYVKHKNNHGQAIARNTGLDNATGEYISFVDSDDFILPDYYELLYNNLQTTNADISICNFKYVNEDEDYIPIYTINKIRVYEDDEKYYYSGSFNCPHNVRRIFYLIRNGLSFPAKIKASQHGRKKEA